MNVQEKRRRRVGRDVLSRCEPEEDEPEPVDEVPSESGYLSRDEIIECVLEIKTRSLELVSPILKLFYSALGESITEPEHFDELRMLGVHQVMLDLFQTVPSVSLLSQVVEIVYKWMILSGDVEIWLQKDFIVPLLLVSSKYPSKCAEATVITMIRILIRAMQANKGIFRDFGLSPTSILERYAQVLAGSQDSEVRKWAATIIESMLNNGTIEWRLDDVRALSPICEHFLEIVETPEFSKVVDLVISFAGRGPEFADAFVSLVPMQELFELLAKAPDDESLLSLTALVTRLVGLGSPQVVAGMAGFSWGWAESLFANARNVECLAALIMCIVANVPMSLQRDDSRPLVTRVIIETVNRSYARKEWWMKCLCEIVLHGTQDVLELVFANNGLGEIMEFTYVQPCTEVFRALFTFFEFSVKTNRPEITNAIRESGCIDEIERLADEGNDDARVFVTKLHELE